MTEYRRSCCSGFHRAIELVGRRWAGVIIYLLNERPSRFAGLQARLPDITPRMLTERLRELEAEGIIERRTVPASPTGVEYALFEEGARAFARAGGDRCLGPPVASRGRHRAGP